MGNEASRPAEGLSPQSSGAVLPPSSPYTPTGASRRAHSFATRSPSPHESPQAAARPSAAKERSIQRMDRAIRRRVRGGVTYNMKLLLRGARGTGKTSLFQRLQGEPIPETHQSTPQLQSATINWSFRTNLEESVRCEVWDVVDRGFVPQEEAQEAAVNGDNAAESDKPVELGGLQSRGSLSAEAAAAAAAAVATMQNGTHSVAIVDASTVDVYHEAHGVIFLLDVTKWDTLEYVKQQLDNVPVHIPTLVLGNFRDQGAERKIFKEDIQELLYGSKERPLHQHWRRPVELLYFECSLLDCYGLKSLHQYFGIPFLQLKLATIRQQVRIVEGEFAHLKHDLQATISEQRYADYVELIRTTGSDIRTGKRVSGVNAPAAPTRQGSGKLEKVAHPDQKAAVQDAADDESIVVSKENGNQETLKEAASVSTAASAPVESSHETQDLAPELATEDLPARSSFAVAKAAAPLKIEHKESVTSMTDEVTKDNRANAVAEPISSREIAVDAVANSNLGRPRKTSVEEVMHLEDFQVPKTRISDLDHFYSEDESEEEEGEYDEDVVVAPADGGMNGTVSDVYHKQRFLDSDSSDSDDIETTRPRIAKKSKSPRKSSPRNAATSSCRN